MLKRKVVLLVMILAGLAQAQGPHEFKVTSDEFDVSVFETVRDEYKATRVMSVTYHVPTSDLAEDRITAVQMGADALDAIKINRVMYSAYGSMLSLEFHYVKVGFYADSRL